MGDRHTFLRFTGGVTNHKTLISRTEFFKFLFSLKTLENIWTLHIQSNNHSTIFIIHSFFEIIITHFFYSLSYNLFIIDLGFRVYFSKDHAHIVFDTSLTGHQTIRVLL